MSGAMIMGLVGGRCVLSPIASVLLWGCPVMTDDPTPIAALVVLALFAWVWLGCWMKELSK